MARNRKRQANGCAWYRKFDRGWYATIKGKRTKLCDESGRPLKGEQQREQAELAVARLKLNLEPVPRGDAVLVAHVVDAYLAYVERQCSARFLEHSTWALSDFCAYCGGLPVSELKKRHVRDWVDTHPGWKSDNTKRDMMAIVMAAFNHAVKEAELIEASPISDLKKPVGFARVTLFKEEEIQEVIDYCNRPPKKKAVSLSPIGQFFRMLVLTGARPFSELAKVTADEVHETEKGMVIRIKAGTDAEGNYRHKAAKRTGKDRVLYLFPEAEEIVRQQVLQFPRGSGVPLFRTPRGRMWRRPNGVTTFLRIKEMLGWDSDPDKRRLSFYTCRHTFAKRILSGYWTGQPASIETLAGLMGNTPKICWDHYARWCDEYNDPLWAAVGRGHRKIG